MWVILTFFFAHWFLSLFCQTFFLHRYSSHRMFVMNKGWERFFYFFTFLFQGASFLNPRAYAIMHRMHHAYSDTEKDPHSPHFIKDVWGLMMKTKRIYADFVKFKIQPEPAFDQEYPQWKTLDRIADSWPVRISFGIGYFAFYYFFAPHWAWFLLLPIHFLVGPIQGAIVNWCGHKYGYSNYDNHDQSKNTFPVDVFLMGELFQNNHHKDPNAPNFAMKWFEWDPSWPIMKFLDFLHIIKLRKA